MIMIKEKGYASPVKKLLKTRYMAAELSSDFMKSRVIQTRFYHRQ